MQRLRLVHTLLLALALYTLPIVCCGATLSAPVNGAPVPLPEGQVLCDDANGGWVPDPSRTKIRPPSDPAQIGKATSIRVASSTAACATSKDADVLVVTGPIPAVDRRTVDLWIDEGHLDLRGTNLDGSRLEWEMKEEHGSGTCVASATTADNRVARIRSARNYQRIPRPLRCEFCLQVRQTGVLYTTIMGGPSLKIHC